VTACDLKKSFSVDKTLEITGHVREFERDVEVHSRSLVWCHFIDYLWFTVGTMSLSWTVFEIVWVILQSGHVT